MGIGLVLFVALLAGNAWHKQRQAERAAAEQRAAERRAAMQLEADRLREERGIAERRRLEEQMERAREAQQRSLAERDLRARDTVEQQRIAEEREARLREAEQRSREVEASLKRLEAERARERTAFKPGPPPEGWRERPPREREARPGGPEDFDELRRRTEADFRAADRNGDGSVTREEAQGRMPLVAREFDRVDANGDGRVSPQELIQFRQEMRSRFGNP